MKLWLIRRMEHVGYDEYDAKVIAAHSEEGVRGLAAINTGDEGKDAWLNSGRSMITEVGLARDPEHEQVILESFNAG